MLIELALLLVTWLGCSDGGSECAVVQTTDVRTPCYLSVDPRLAGRRRRAPFAYLANLPEPSPQIPCPVLQTLDPEETCYARPHPGHRDVPAYYLTVPLPDGVDDTEVLVERLRANRKKEERMKFEMVQSSILSDEPQRLEVVPQTIYGAPSV